MTCDFLVREVVREDGTAIQVWDCLGGLLRRSGTAIEGVAIKRRIAPPHIYLWWCLGPLVLQGKAEAGAETLDGLLESIRKIYEKVGSRL